MSYWEMYHLQQPQSYLARLWREAYSEFESKPLERQLGLDNLKWRVIRYGLVFGSVHYAAFGDFSEIKLAVSLGITWLLFKGFDFCQSPSDGTRSTLSRTGE